MTLAAMVLGIVLILAITRCMSGIVDAQTTPSLVNPGLERPYSPRGASEVEVAEWWEPWWREGDGYHRPEFKPMEEPDRVFEGQTSQKTFTVYAKHFGGLYQIVDGLTEGDWYIFSCQLQMKSNGGKSFGAVGVNQWGNAWPQHWTTTWGRAAYNNFNHWQEVEVVFQAWSTKAALLTMGEGEYAVPWQDWYWDACVLRPAEDPVAPTATPGVPVACPAADEIRQIVETVVADREPVQWPRE